MKQPEASKLVHENDTYIKKEFQSPIQSIILYDKFNIK